MRRFFCALSISFLAWTSQARACEVALLLAVDVSGSVDPSEYRIQMGGLSAALRDGLVSEALVVGQANVALMQWSGSSRQEISLPWFAIRDFEDVERFARMVDETPRLWRNYSTAIGEALLLGLETMQTAPDCERLVIDVSGDGESNEGVVPQDVKPLMARAGITVNGLVIDTRNEGILEYYRSNVITGQESFVVSANSFDEYPDRIREKLIRELTKQFAAR
ncbi:MAG: DUF1194 domain-containing protein [Cognatishimia activa]